MDKKEEEEKREEGDEAHFCQLLFSRASNWSVVLNEIYPLSTISVDFRNFPRVVEYRSKQPGFKFERKKEKEDSKKELIGNGDRWSFLDDSIYFNFIIYANNETI